MKINPAEKAGGRLEWARTGHGGLFRAFDSNSLDMIIWPELDECLFDSTAPHLYEPSRPEDDVIDMYAACVRPGTDEKHDRALLDIALRYKEAVGNGTKYLAEAKDIWINSPVFTPLQRIRIRSKGSVRNWPNSCVSTAHAQLLAAS